MTIDNAASMSRLEWTKNLKVHSKVIDPRKTSIICTIGPKTNNVQSILNLRKAGMNIVRMNFSHGSHEYHASVISNVRESIAQHPGTPVAIALDTKGPEIRTGKMMGDQEMEIPAGHHMILTTDDAFFDVGNMDTVYVDYEKLPEVTSVGKYIYVDDGQLRLRVEEINGNEIHVQAMNSWKISNNKGVNLPMVSF